MMMIKYGITLKRNGWVNNSFVPKQYQMEKTNAVVEIIKRK